jgi:hypothetical protein
MATPGQRGWNAVVSKNTTDLFDEILGDRHIEAEDGRQYVPLSIAEDANVESEPDQDCL